MTEYELANRFAEALTRCTGYDAQYVSYSSDDDEPFTDVVIYFDKRVAGRLTFDDEGRLINAQAEEF